MKRITAFSLRGLLPVPRIPDHLFARLQRARLSILFFSFFGACAPTAFGQLSYSSQTTPYEFAASGFGLVQVADFNGDGYVDIAIGATATGGGITYLQNNGSGSFSTPGTNPFSAYTATTPAGFTMTNSTTTVADYDSDGDLDIWCRVANAGNDVYLRNNNGTYGSVTPPYEFAGTGLGLVQVADFNGDGHVDIAVGAVGTGVGITYLQNNGSGSFSTPGTNPFSAYTATTPTGFTLLNTGTTVADYDGDGDLDIWCRIANAGNDVYLRNNNGTYGSVTPPYEFAGTGLGLVQVTDFDGDGYVDIAIGAVGTGVGITYLQNNGSGSFSTPAGNPFATYTATTPAGFTLLNTGTTVADYDGDGDLDIWCRVNSTSNDVYLRGSGEAPELISSVPVNNAVGFPISSNMVLTFSENVATGPGNIYIRRLSDNVAVQTIVANGAAVAGSGTATLTINPPANLALNTTYYVTFDQDAIADVDEGLIFGYIDPGQNNTRVPYTQNDFLRFTTATSSLPVTLTRFTATRSKDNALLEWQTANEQNTRDFTIQYSNDGASWSVIGVVKAAGNSSRVANYQFLDPQVLRAKNYYRLVQTDLDGTQSVSAVQLLQADQTTSLVVYPNPVADEATLRLPEGGPGVVVLYNSIGQEVYRNTVDGTNVLLSLKALPSGGYHVVVLQNGKRYAAHVQHL